MTEDTSPENLRKFLESDDPAIVRMGISLAKGAGVEVSAKDLENFLNCTDIEKNKIGLSLADEAGVGDDAIKILCGPLKDEDEWVRFETVGKLRSLGDSRPTKELIELLREVNQHYAGEPPNQVWRGSGKVAKAVKLALTDMGAIDLLIEAFENYSPPFIGSAEEDLFYDSVDEDSRLLPSMQKAGNAGQNPLEMMREGMAEGERIREERVEKYGPMDQYNRVKQYDKNLKAKIEKSGTENLTDEEWEFVVEQRDYIFDVKIGIAEVLGKIGDVRAVEPLIKELKDGLAPAPAGDPYDSHTSPKVAEASAIALGDIGDNRAVDSLIWGLCLGDDDYRRQWYECKSAIVALGNIGDVKAVEPLIMKVGSTYLPGDVDQVIEALGKIGDTRAIDPIVKFLGNPEGYCDKDNAVETLKKLGHEISRKDIKCKSWSEE